MISLNKTKMFYLELFYKIIGLIFGRGKCSGYILITPIYKGYNPKHQHRVYKHGQYEGYLYPLHTVSPTVNLL
jgi:hypothetical protein